MSRHIGKPTICIGENKGADQLRSNCETDQHLCFRCTDSTIPLLSKSKISSLYPSSETVQPDLCQIWSVFSRIGSYDNTLAVKVHDSFSDFLVLVQIWFEIAIRLCYIVENCIGSVEIDQENYYSFVYQ